MDMAALQWWMERGVARPVRPSQMRSGPLLLALVLTACASAPVTAVGVPAFPTACHATARGPDPTCTPGLRDPNARVGGGDPTTDICAVGHSTAVRPPLSYTEPLKRKLVRVYGLTGSLSLYELDHLVPLELGGAPRDVRNLWPQPWAGPWGAHAKDKVENALHAQVCAHTLALRTAQRQMAHWGQ